MKKSIIFLALIAISTIIKSQNCDICDKVLVQDILQYNYTSTVSLHYLNTISFDNYRKKEIQSTLSGYFPIEGVPVGGEIGYDEFEEFRQRLYHKTNFKFTKEESLSILKQEFNKNTLSAFNECYNACINSVGLFAYIYDISDDEISIAYNYKTLPGSKERIILKRLNKTNLTFLTSSDSIYLSSKHFINPNEIKIIRFKRNDIHKNSVVNIDFILNNTTISKEIKITALPIIKKYKIIRLDNPDKGSNYYYTNANIIRGALQGDGDYGRGTIFKNDPSLNHNIEYGQWANFPECGTYGNGWYITNIGSCGQGHGSLIKGLLWVEIIVEDK